MSHLKKICKEILLLMQLARGGGKKFTSMTNCPTFTIIICKKNIKCHLI